MGSSIHCERVYEPIQEREVIRTVRTKVEGMDRDVGSRCYQGMERVV